MNVHFYFILHSDSKFVVIFKFQLYAVNMTNEEKTCQNYTKIKTWKLSFLFLKSTNQTEFVFYDNTNFLLLLEMELLRLQLHTEIMF